MKYTRGRRKNPVNAGWDNLTGAFSYCLWKMWFIENTAFIDDECDQATATKI